MVSPVNNRIATNYHYTNSSLSFLLFYLTTSWNNSIGNKLLDIKPTIGEYQSVVRNIRKEKVVFARLRLGHTRVTHSYLLHVLVCLRIQRLPVLSRPGPTEIDLFTISKPPYYHNEAFHQGLRCLVDAHPTFYLGGPI